MWSSSNGGEGLPTMYDQVKKSMLQPTGGFRAFHAFFRQQAS